MANLVVRVWLPDRPGALGLVASRIGAIGGDIVGVEVLERSETIAVDEFAVVIGDPAVLPLLVREIEEVDGASVEEWRTVESFPDARLDALASAEALCAAAPDVRLTVLAERTRDEFEAEWVAVVRDERVLAAAGPSLPASSVLGALAAGTSASPTVVGGETGPDDLAVAPLPTRRAVLLMSRSGHPFRRRERRQLLALARIADRLDAPAGS